MTLTITHAFSSPKADNPTAAAAGEILPSHWNQGHVIAGTVGPSVGARTLLTVNPTNFYVNNLTGSDSNDGLTLGTAWATLQHFWDTLTSSYDLGGLIAAQANLAASGTPYTLNAFLSSAIGGAQINIVGAGSGTTTINDALIQTHPMCEINFGSVKLADGGSGDCLQLYSLMGRVGLLDADVVFAGTPAATFAHILVDGNCAFIGFEQNFRVSGNATYIFFIASFSASFFANCTATFVGTPVVTQTFNVTGFSQFNSTNMVYSGAVTGSRFNITGQSVIQSDGTLPGSTDGTIDASSCYLVTAPSFGPVIGIFIGPLPGIDTQTGANYTLALSDINLRVEMNNAGANTLTVPTNASVAFPVGALIKVTQIGAGATTIVGAGGVTVHNAGVVGGQWSTVTLYKRGTNEWVQTGV